jgi:polyphosphate:AMP phosphotransferase
MTQATSLLSVAEVGHEISREHYEERLEALRVELLNLQYDLQAADFSVLILVVGDDRPGCVQAVRVLHEWMDQRFIDTHVFYGPPSEAERERPVVWRYWRRLAAKGRTGLFLGAWPAFVVQSALAEEWTGPELDAALDHAERFERALVDDGTLLLKFWVHLPKSVLKKRLNQAKKSPDRHWHFEERDWEILEQFDEGIQVVERLLHRTNVPRAPWAIIESTDNRYRNLTIGEHVAGALKKRLSVARVDAPKPVSPIDPPVSGQSILDQIDLTAVVPADEYSERLDDLQSRLNELTRAADEVGVACVMAFEGSDAAGKGGVIRRVTKAIPIQTVQVISVAAPTEEERARHYLWRFWRHIPAAGHTVIFDRSWYGRVLVERVEGFAEEREWSRAYEEINDFESVLDESGVVVLKFWLQIDADEQLQRFEARAKTPYKKYKLTDEDYRNREKWDLYQQAVHDMVARTSTSYAPWYLVGANDKKHARLTILETICDRLQARLDERNAKNKKKKKNRKKRGS